MEWNDDLVRSEPEDDSDSDEFVATDSTAAILEKPVPTTTIIENIDNIIKWGAVIGDIETSDIAVLRKLRERALLIKRQEKLKQQKITSYFSNTVDM